MTDPNPDIDPNEEFLIMVAHELRSPLTVLSGYAQMLAASGALVGEERHALEMILRSCQHLARLITTLIELDRIRQGSAMPRYVPGVSLQGAVVEVVQELRLSLLRQTIMLELEDRPAPVEGDPGLIGLAVYHLVHNAMRQSALDGAVRVTVGRDKASAVLAVEYAGQMGSGLLNWTFAPFSRQTGALDYYASGLGIGLYVARVIAQTYGGNVTVNTNEKDWVMFRLSLPEVGSGG